VSNSGHDVAAGGPCRHSSVLAVTEYIVNPALPNGGCDLAGDSSLPTYTLPADLAEMEAAVFGRRTDDTYAGLLHYFTGDDEGRRVGLFHCDLLV
jgi:hypothetical protein